MNKFIVALLLLPFTQSAVLAQSAGDAKEGQAFWEGNQSQCKNCHGRAAEGALGPDLAGRGLSVAQFKVAVRKPWGVMPAFIDSQISDQDIANVVAWSASLPKKDQPGAWRTEVPADAPAGQAMMINRGCGQCHGATLTGPRTDLGAVNASFEYFRDLVYHHTDAMPKHLATMGSNGPARRLQMGNFSPARLSENDLRLIYQWAHDEAGFRPALTARLSAGTKSDKGVTYNLHLENGGVKGKGLAAQSVTVTLILPAGATVVGTTGAGYKGVKEDPEAKANVAVWQISRSAPKDALDLSITLSKAGTRDDNLRGSVRWKKPGPKKGPSSDVVNIAPAPLS